MPERFARRARHFYMECDRVMDGVKAWEAGDIEGFGRPVFESCESSMNNYECGSPELTCWGDGSPLREFLYVDDLANLCVFLMNNYSGNETVNAGTGKELTIKELTELVASIVGVSHLFYIS